ncbi:MAG: DUF2339 domain-containing protein [Ginsengibacter sp.]
MQNDNKLTELLKKIDILSLQIEKCKEEINLIKNEVSGLNNNSTLNESKLTPESPRIKPAPPKPPVPGFENFIGLKLINFVGIIVLIAGLTIGVKYVIDINLISPFMRIMLTYAAGVVLFFISLRLRKKYQLFSMILFSGSMASVYFTTYAAYEYYALIPRVTAFSLMLIFTFFTVYNSIKYNRQEIAILGLVGAYGIPFFVKGNSENITVLFSYIFIINFGVLLISFKKYWLSLMYISFFTTWLIYLSWVVIYSAGDAHEKGIIFCYAFFIFFLFNSLAFKVLKRLTITPSDTFLVITNTAFLYFSLVILYKEYGRASIENITLYFGILYLAAGIAVKKYISRQQHLYNGLFCVSVTAMVAFAAIKYINFTLTIVWVAMAVIMFVMGMVFRLKTFRISAILLFAVTLIKLLLMDSIKFNSIEKVSAYIVIGIVLLIISFLYQKYKKIIFEPENH